MTPDILRLVLEGGGGLLALYLLHGMRGDLAALSARMDHLFTLLLKGKHDDEG